MTKLQRAILILLLHLTLVFNLERLTASAPDASSSQILFYGTIILAVLSVLIIPALARAHFYIPLTLWITVYLVIWQLLPGQHPLFGEQYTYITITELTLLALTVFFSYELARRLRDVEDIIEMITFADLEQRSLPFDEATEEIKTELMRSRRHNRPLSVLVIAPSTTATTKEELSATLKEIQKAMVNRYLAASLAQVISRATRRIDLVLEQDDKHSRFIVICPETTAEGSQVVAERIKAIAQEQVGIPVYYGKATFPDEGLTFEDLLDKAESGLADSEGYSLKPGNGNSNGISAPKQLSTRSIQQPIGSIQEK